jgi:hypothetical protein
MTKKNILTAVTVLLLASLSLYINRWRFASQPLEISHRSMPPRGPFPQRNRQNTTVNPVLFLLNQKARLTSLKVVLADEFATNKYALAVWNLDSTSNSIPLKEFFYGQNINGMKQKVKGAAPESLQPNVKYHLFVEAGPLKADHEFTPVPPMR